MDLLSPKWLILCLLPIILLVAGIVMHKRSNKNWKAFVSSPTLAARLVTNASSVPFWVSIFFILISTFLMIVTLTMPTGGRERIELPTTGSNIYLALDLSRSMLVKDVSPDRLTFAKTAALDIIEAFPDEKIGLISFAGNAWLEAPLSPDHNALREAVLQMNENSIPFGGSDSSPLMRLILDTIPEDEQSEALLIIISDGEFHEAPSEKMINKVVDKGLKIFTLGIGTVSGGQIPDEQQRDGIYKNRLGRPVLSSLQTAPLERIALLGNGSYYSGDDYSFLPLMQRTLGLMQKAETGTRDIIIHKHLYPFFLIPSLLFIVFAMITPNLWKTTQKATVIGVLFFLLPAQESSAKLLSSYEEGEGLMNAERYEEAAAYYLEQTEDAPRKLYETLHYSRGVSSYKGELYPDAVESFSKSLLSEDPALQTESHYNLGNTLFKFGEKINTEIPSIKDFREQLLAREAVIYQWRDALDHYNSSLDLTPEHPSARPNYDYVKTLLEDLEEKQEEELQKMQMMGEGQGSGQGDGQGEGGSSGSQTWDQLKEGKEKAEKEKGSQGGEEKESPGNGGDKKEEKGDGPDGEEEGDEGSGGDEEDEQASSGTGGRKEELERRPGETKEDYARRRLEEHSDFESGNLRTYRKTYSRPKKDW